MVILWVLAAVAVLLVGVVLLRALCFRPRTRAAGTPDSVEFDADAAVDALAQLVRCKTVSYYDSALEDDAEFSRLIALLPQLYPRVFSACSFTQLPDRALLFRWPGKASDAPSVMMAHYDVVPADESGWEKPPFAGEIAQGVLWGRGTLDTKATFNGILFAADRLIADGFVPEQDVYFAFSGGEEVNGAGAPRIVSYFRENGIKPALVLDEGGAVVEQVFPGVSLPCGLIGIAEKGYMNLHLSAKSSGGHASAPKPHTPVGILSRACQAVENHPFPMHLSRPVAQMFDVLGRHSSFGYRLIFANLNLFGGLLGLLGRKSGGEMNALLRTTVAFTQATGSPAPNVIPPNAEFTANLRLNPEDSVEDAVAYIRRVIGDDAVTLTVSSCAEPSPVSQTNCPSWDKVASAVSDTWPGAIVAPYLMLQCSDSRHYAGLSDHVYRFSAMDLTAEERATIHGHNERIRLESIQRVVEFYIRLMKQC